MRIILYIMVLLLMLLSPVTRLDIAKLEPVEAVAVYTDRGCVVLETDTQAVGRGKTARDALEDLKESTPAVVYLDTADYLLVGEGADEAAMQLRAYLKKSVKTGVYHGTDVKAEAKYLDVHSESAKPGE